MAGDGACPGGGFGTTHAEQEDGLAVVGDDVADESGGGPDFHPVGAPAEGAIGRGIALAEEVDPEALLREGLGADDADGDVEAFEALFEAFEESIHEVLEDRGLDLGVVADDVDASATVLRGDVADGLQDEVEQEGGVLATGEANDPGAGVGGEVVIAQLAADALELDVQGVEVGGRCGGRGHALSEACRFRGVAASGEVGPQIHA